MTTLVVGDNGSNTLSGSADSDLIYGFNPNGQQSQVSQINATRVASGLNQPLFAGAPPGDTHRLFLVEKGGLIKILNLDTGQVLATPFLNVSTQISAAGEGGLLGLAFDPDFAQNGFFYVNMINTSGDTEIRRFHVSAGTPNQADPGSTLIIRIDQPDGRTNHKAGWLGFSPDDGFLYVPLGDGGGGGDPDGNAQNLNSLLGKVLRLDVHGDDFPGDATRNYAIPADNPFVGASGLDEIWALGLRNPFRDSFDRGLGTFFIADVGQNMWEEVNIGQSGGNYGWDKFEGPDPFEPGTPTGGTAIPPIFAYDHSVGNVITGGYVYRGTSEGLQGHYFFADFGARKVFTLHFNGSTWVATERTDQILANIGTLGNISSFGEDGFGNLYAVDFDGEVFRLSPVAVSGDQADVLNGLAGADMLHGGSGNDVLNGGEGPDFLNGGPGFDFATYANAPTGIVASLTDPRINTGEAAGDIYASIEGLIGSSFDDRLFGDTAANILIGGSGDDRLIGAAGNDSLNGGAGADLLDGGAGSDTAVYLASNAGVQVNLNLVGAQSGGHAAGDTLVAVENVIGSSFADFLTGNGAANVLNGVDGNDVLIGGGGNDTLIGGDGNDTLVGRGGNDTLNGGPGTDTVHYAGSPAGVTVNLGAGTATGGWGNDTIIAAEKVIGTAFNDVLTGNSGANLLAGLGGNDALNGAGGNDNLSGAHGNDVLIGGPGKDGLLGGNDADIFRFNSITETLPGAPRDVIMDFSRAQGDKIDVSGIDARLDLAGNQAFTFIGTAAFTGIDGQLRQGGNVIQGDVNGDQVADFEIVWNFAGANLIASDFIL